MARLYLNCAICGRKQADGLLSRGHWGHILLADGTERQACPSCKVANADWETTVVRSSEGRVGGTYAAGLGDAADPPAV